MMTMSMFMTTTNSTVVRMFSHLGPFHLLEILFLELELFLLILDGIAGDGIDIDIFLQSSLSLLRIHFSLPWTTKNDKQTHLLYFPK